MTYGLCGKGVGMWAVAGVVWPWREFDERTWRLHCKIICWRLILRSSFKSHSGISWSCPMRSFPNVLSGSSEESFLFFFEITDCKAVVAVAITLWSSWFCAWAIFLFDLEEGGLASAYGKLSSSSSALLLVFLGVNASFRNWKLS